MSMDVEGLQELLEHFLGDEGEIERTVPSCDTCLHEEKCDPDKEKFECGGPQCCARFIPKTWREHVLIAGEWWS